MFRVDLRGSAAKNQAKSEKKWPGLRQGFDRVIYRWKGLGLAKKNPKYSFLK